jgi:predicted ribosome quality control (RQC) complex YloA/Tae2 family protein
MLDGITLFAITKEFLNNFKGAKIIDISQTKKYKIIIEIILKKALKLAHSNKEKRIFCIHISIDPSLPEIYFSECQDNKNFINTPFLALIQNQLKGGKILDIKQIDFDRILHFSIQPYTKFGETSNKTLIVEFMGKHSNIILLKEDNIIEGSLKSVASDINRYREILPGKSYIPPPSQNKLNPLKINKKHFFDIFYSCNKKNMNYWQLLQANFKGLSQQSAKEIILQANLFPGKELPIISDTELESLWYTLNNILKDIKNYNFYPAIFFDPASKKIKTHSIINSMQFPQYNRLDFNNTNSCLKFLFTELEKERKMSSLKTKLEYILHKNIVKAEIKTNSYLKKIEEVKNCERYRIRGELIKANLANIKRGDSKITIVNYYSPKQENITISLDKKLTPLLNAQLYFKKYRKTKDSYDIIWKQLKNRKLKLAKLIELQKSLEQDSNSLSKLSKIYQILAKLGYIKEKVKPTKKKKRESLFPSEYISKDGWKIYVGKNNKQNDFLTLKLASGNDLWLHAKNIRGSHVIIKNKGNGQTIPLSTLIQAANLAAHFSKSKNDNKVQVDYTPKKYVKKPKNAKPGMVIYSHEKSLLIKIDSEEISKIKKIS